MWFQLYRKALENEHGWEVELTCPNCHYHGVPAYGGWSPRHSPRFGTRAPTVYSLLSCPRCSRDLRAEAEAKLIELFGPVKLPSANKAILALFIVWVASLIVLSELIIQGTINISFLRNNRELLTAIVLVLGIGSIPYFNYKIASLTMRCPCDNPDYLFMGNLGRTYCYRCCTCSRLLRLRD